MIASALQYHTVSGFAGLGGKVEATSFSDLTIAQGSSFNLSFDNKKDVIIADFRESQKILTALGSDFCRFSNSAFQSIMPISDEIVEKDKLAWSMVKLYYSAFYAGHSIIRALGESCSFLDGTHVRRFNALATAMGTPPMFSIKAGLYQCSVDSSTTIVNYVKAGGAVGGTHEAFWAIFEKEIRKLSPKILSSSMERTEALQVVERLYEFEQLLKGINPVSHGALCLVRNELQYKHGFGVWFPTRVRKDTRKRFGRLVTQWLRDPMDRAGPGNLHRSIGGFSA